MRPSVKHATDPLIRLKENKPKPEKKKSKNDQKWATKVNTFFFAKKPLFRPFSTPFSTPSLANEKRDENLIEKTEEKSKKKKIDEKTQKNTLFYSLHDKKSNHVLKVPKTKK